MQLQQTELVAAHREIGALKKHVGCLAALSVCAAVCFRLWSLMWIQGLDVQHVATALKKTRDPHAAGDVLKKVLDKHHRQRETRNYDPDAHKESSKSSKVLKSYRVLSHPKPLQAYGLRACELSKTRTAGSGPDDRGSLEGSTGAGRGPSPTRGKG